MLKTTQFPTKLLSILLSVMVLFMSGGTGTVLAQTDVRQAQIEQLDLLISQLQAQILAMSSTPVPTSAVCPYVWTRNLGVGSVGTDVQKLQQFLNSDPNTKVAVTGIGSTGQESLYYGPLTAAAVAKFQVKYRSEVLTPIGLFNPTGYFGAMTRTKANTLCIVIPPISPIDDQEQEEDEDVVLRGEGTIDNFTIDDPSDTEIEEGEEDAPIAEITIEADNGDIEINRIDIALVGINTPTEDEPWDVFEDFSLWVDGDLVDRINADDEDDYLDEDQGTIRFSRLGIILKEHREVDVVITASVQPRVRGAGVDADWTVAVESIRYFDGDGVATDEGDVDEIGDVVAFEIVEKGADEKLNFSLSSDNPEATDIIVDEDRKTKDETILAYTIEAEGNDIELDRLFVNVVTSATSSRVIDGIRLVIDGESFRDENQTVNSNFDVTFEFDIDRDIKIDRNDEVEVEVVIDFEEQDGNYDNGTTIQAKVTSVERDVTKAEGVDDVRNFSGTAVGKVHTLVARGAVVATDSTKDDFETLGRDGATGVFTLEFNVKAVEDNFYITDDVSLDAGVATTGVAYKIDSPSGFDVASSVVSTVLTSTAREDVAGVFTVFEGQTETFTLTVVINPNVSGFYRVSLTEVNYDNDASGRASTNVYVPIPVQDYRTSYGFINN